MKERFGRCKLIIKRLLIFLFLIGCSNQEQMLQNCADDYFKSVSVKYQDEFLKLNNKQKMQNPFDAIGPIDKNKYKTVLDEKKLNNFLKMNLKNKLKLSSYEEDFKTCVDLKNNNPEIFKAKYK